MYTTMQRLAYTEGHRDARHAAAELAQAHEAHPAPARDEAGERELEAQCRGLIASHGEGVMAPLSARDLLNLLARARYGQAETQRLREALEAWMEFNSETKAENPCPDYALRARLREKAKALSNAALAPGGGRDAGTKGAE